MDKLLSIVMTEFRHYRNSNEGKIIVGIFFVVFEFIPTLEKIGFHKV